MLFEFSQMIAKCLPRMDIKNTNKHKNDSCHFKICCWHVEQQKGSGTSNQMNNPLRNYLENKLYDKFAII